MKKLIALAGAALFALFAGTDFITPKQDNFRFNPETGVGDYFQVEIAEEGVNYRSLYGQVYGFNWDNGEMCDTTQRQDVREVWTPIVEKVPGWSGSLYEPVDANLASFQILGSSDGVRYTITADDDVNICAPAAGTINTSHYACNFGHTMEYLISFSDGSTYTMTVDGAKCWYCCAAKTIPEDGRYTATTRDSLKGKTMRAGDVLCVGKADTTITIIRTTH